MKRLPGYGPCSSVWRPFSSLCPFILISTWRPININLPRMPPGSPCLKSIIPWGIDGISLLLVLLSTLLTPICVLASWKYIEKRVKEFHVCLLFMETACVVFLRPRFRPFLHFLGSHAGPHVLIDRRLGRSAQGLRLHQVLSSTPWPAASFSWWP